VKEKKNHFAQLSLVSPSTLHQSVCEAFRWNLKDLKGFRSKRSKRLLDLKASKKKAKTLIRNLNAFNL
jgi:hypothetical protein